MYITIDISVVPPTTVLHEAEDLTSFKVVVADVDHAYVPVAAIRELAGERADDPEWEEGLAKMLDFAEQRGWLDERGVQAHVERES